MAVQRNKQSLIVNVGYTKEEVKKPITTQVVIEKIERFDNTPVYVIIYNIGASYIQVSLVEYSTVKTSFSKLSDKKNENIRILAST